MTDDPLSQQLRVFPSKPRGWLLIGLGTVILTPFVSLMVVFAAMEVGRLPEHREYQAVVLGVGTFATGVAACIQSFRRFRSSRREQRGFEIVGRTNSLQGGHRPPFASGGRCPPCRLIDGVLKAISTILLGGVAGFALVLDKLGTDLPHEWRARRRDGRSVLSIQLRLERIGPRARKRRPKEYDLKSKPRQQMRNDLKKQAQKA